MKKIMKTLPHISIALSGMFIILWVLDIINPTMVLINRNSSNKLLLILFVLNIVNCIALVYYQRKNKSKDNII